MTEKVLSNKKNGMAMMILWIVLYLVALLMTILGAALIWPLFIIGVVWLCIGWIKSIKATRSLGFDIIW